MYADGTGLLTDAMHDGRWCWSLPFPSPGGISGETSGEHSRSEDAAACANHSCGAVAESHRASRAFRIGTKSGGERTAVRCHAAGKNERCL